MPLPSVPFELPAGGQWSQDVPPASDRRRLPANHPFAIVTSRLFGLEDPRKYGSGNPGATNVLRSGGKGGRAHLLGDAQGLAGGVGGLRLGFEPDIAALAGLAAFLDHVFSLFLRFNGGKGVATALGVLAGSTTRIAIFCAVIWLMWPTPRASPRPRRCRRRSPRPRRPALLGAKPAVGCSR